MVIPSLPAQTSVQGRGSWFGGPNDPGAQGAPAGGQGWSQPIIAVYNRATLGGYWRVTAPNGRTAVVKQGDLGPHPDTGRAVDIGYNALGKFGYTQQNFPTDQGKWQLQYLGKNPGAAAATGVGQQQRASLPSLPGQPQAQQPGKLAALAPLLNAKSAFDIGTPKIPGLGSPTASLKAAGLFNTGTPPVAQPKAQPQQPQDIVGAAAGHYVNPFEGAQVQPSRIDQGVDYVVHGPIRAIGNATVKGIFHYQGFGTYMAYQLNDGPLAGHLIYVSEGMTPTVHEGQQLRAGQVIAYGNGAIEKGFAQNAPGYLPAAQTSGGYTEGALTSAGDSFNRLMTGLGVPSGTRGGRQVVGSYGG